ncbi:MAG: haloacid dehalogenase-like hydrolase [Alphaproteobacteria bacterium]|nr:haloacid dehalogenase-like hydrolase [Alphaproteobacteria bacterium]
MNGKKTTVALCYDFDGTLAPGCMQEYSFMRALGEDPKQFWHKSHILAKKQQADDIASYMQLMLDECRKKGLKPTRKAFRLYGQGIPLYKGVETWFKRINQYARQKGVNLRHYIISSGLKEMIEGTSIAQNFHKIYASSFMYDKKDEAIWPAVTLNYTSKTQFLFRINKGCEDITDNTSINQYVPTKDRPVPFQNIIYIGDGETDIPCMKMINQHGGHAIAVYHPDKESARQTAQKLVQDKRVNIALPANYATHQPIEKYVQAVIDKIVADTQIEKYETIYCQE